MTDKTRSVSSGIPHLNQLLNGLYIGDNVVWYDDAGSLAAEFCRKFIQESEQQEKAIVYVSFDRSPKNLVEKLGLLAQNQQLTLLDCFTNGKGDKAEVFNKFYEKDGAHWPYKVIRVTRPDSPQAVSEAIYSLHKTLAGDVRFIFESLTGMADLWNGEEHILKFYSHACPQLYELDTIAYWMIEKAAHSNKLKAHINQIAQVAIDLSIDQGKTRICLLKAEGRSPKALGRSLYYSYDGSEFTIEDSHGKILPHDLGSAIKTYRKKQGMSQKELSILVGVTPSNISQIESNQVFPSIPALYKIASQLSVDVSSLFIKTSQTEPAVFKALENASIQLPGSQRREIEICQLTPFDLDGKMDLFKVTLLPGKKLAAHFFQYKGEEAGYLLSGSLEVECQDQTHSLEAGDTLYLKTTSPTRWQNPGRTPAILLWMKIK